jgi:ABC-type dipeptide/oligopeptide/nickel transport system permease subunit
MKGGQAELEIGFLAAIIATVAAMLCEAIFGLAGGIMDSEAAGNPR